MISSQFNCSLIRLSETTSTNSYALELIRQKKANEGTLVLSEYQSQGKGQQGNLWESEKAKNLLMSLIIHPKLKVENRFFISQCVALGIKSYLDSLSVGIVQIKWPNDILVNKDKIAGILIENFIEKDEIHTSIIGIGLNVNQLKFKEYDRTAISLCQLQSVLFDLDEVRKQLVNHLVEAFRAFDLHGKSYIQTHYLQYLYGYHETLDFEDIQGRFKGKIAHIDRNGMIQVWRNGRLCSYDMKELKFIA